MTVSVETEDTILDTPLTWDVLQKDMQANFKTKAELGPSRKAEIFGVGSVRVF